MATIKKITVPFTYIILFILMAPCDPGALSETMSIQHIRDLDVIEIKLAWQKQYEATTFFDGLIPAAYAALPPDYQRHYKHRLQFNHQAQTITDSYLHFTGTDSAAMVSSEIMRGPVIYNQFKTFLEGKVFLHQVRREMIVGPARAVITFIKKDNSTQSACFYGQNISGKEAYELSSKEFSLFLTSLRENR